MGLTEKFNNAMSNFFKNFYLLSSLLAEGFVEEPPPKELLIVFSVKCFKAATLRKY